MNTRRAKSFQKTAIIIAILSACLILLLGISLIIIGEDLRICIVGIVFGISINIVLFYGAKTKDTTHFFLWLFVSAILVVGLIVGMAYFAYKSEKFREMYTSNTPDGSFQNETKANILRLRNTTLAYAVISGLFTIFLVSVSIVIKKIYNEIQSEDTQHRHVDHPRVGLLGTTPLVVDTDLETEKTKVISDLVVASLITAAAVSVHSLDSNEVADDESSLASMSSISDASSCSSPSGGGSHSSTDQPSDTISYD